MCEFVVVCDNHTESYPTIHHVWTITPAYTILAFRWGQAVGISHKLVVGRVNKHIEKLTRCRSAM